MLKVEEILQEFKAGGKSMRQVFNYLKKLPHEDLRFAKVDHHRSLRRGYPEVVWGESKTVEQILAVTESIHR